MKSKIGWLILSCVLILSLVLSSCGTKTTTTVTSTTSTTKMTAEKPKYGGTIIYQTSREPARFDPYNTNVEQVQCLYFETLGIADLTVDRKLCSFIGGYVPMEYTTGRLVESWELPDLHTVIFHVRKGINWQDKAPVNGREFTAYDIEYHYHRMFGLGSGFTQKSPFQTSASYDLMQSVTATDKYTVVFNWKQDSLDIMDTLLLQSVATNEIEAREAVEQWGNLDNWEHAIGTGAYILDDYVSGSSVAFSKNPNYWGYDSSYPQNKLPYADEVKFAIIPDTATSISAMRTGKIDLLVNIAWDKASDLGKTNPELQQIKVPPSAGRTLDFRVDMEPYNNLKVRIALQKAIDLKTISETLYGGLADPTPTGIVASDMTKYYVPFAQWPKELQEEYTYDPEVAKNLLAEAGYPKGFQTNVLTSSTWDIDLLEVIKSYFVNIGVDLEIKVVEQAVLNSMLAAGKHDALFPLNSTAMRFPIARFMSRRVSTNYVNYTHNNDATYDDLYNRFNTSLSEDERTKLIKEADMYDLQKHWSIFLPTPVSFNICQPWIKGYAGEQTAGGPFFNNMWVDQDVKKAMGY